MALIPIIDIYEINGKKLPSPSKANPKISGLQIFAKRTDDGLLHKETITYKRTVVLTYDVLTDDEYKSILNLIITDPISEYFTLKYKDPQKGITTITCFANEFEGDLYSAIFYNGLWRNVPFNCVER